VARKLVAVASFWWRDDDAEIAVEGAAGHAGVDGGERSK
jgi:hypothetical protein